jgi:hypothetical protein
MFSASGRWHFEIRKKSCCSSFSSASGKNNVSEKDFNESIKNNPE